MSRKTTIKPLWAQITLQFHKKQQWAQKQSNLNNAINEEKSNQDLNHLALRSEDKGRILMLEQ